MPSSWLLTNFTISLCILLFFLFCKPSVAITQYVDTLTPGFEASQSDWRDHGGIFLLSNNSVFGFGFYASGDSSLFLLVVMHMKTQSLIWSANQPSLVGASDKFVFDKTGKAYLSAGSNEVFSMETNGGGGKAKDLKLQDSGNLVLRDENGNSLWDSFSHPTDTLITGQKFLDGMKLISFPNKNVNTFLEMKTGDLVLYAAFDSPQVYWSLSNDTRKMVVPRGDQKSVSSATLEANSWNFYDKTGQLAWQFNFSKQVDDPADVLWSAVLGSDGSIQFYNLKEGNSVSPESTRIPQNPCSSPLVCAPFEVCFGNKVCQCPSALSSYSSCRPNGKPNCSNSSNDTVKFQAVIERVDYSAIKYATPERNASNQESCQKACLANCTCTAAFFDSSSDSCFLFDRIGSFQRSDQNSKGYFLAVKVFKDDNNGSKRGVSVAVIVVAVVVPLMILIGMAWFVVYMRRRKKRLCCKQPFQDDEEVEEEDSFKGIIGMPVRYSYNELKIVTRDFSVILGRGGFGSVYLGIQEDGSKLAVKKLEGIGQGKKEFSAEVNIIGSVHHLHLVKLRGFCAEGPHRLLVYEHMANGSLEQWIFKNDKQQGPMLNWETRFNIALGTAKGLAYLHEECESKIVHCDIKPENVLLDERFSAKVSDFGLAKMMNREQSVVMTTLRGTRGYLAPEWLTNYAISEKSDVYSYGMLLLEILSGRKNFDTEMTSEKAYLPSYAFKMMEEGKLKEILDTRMSCGGDEEMVIRAIKIALWCIQDDIGMRPPMTKVVQMLEGMCLVPDPPVSCQTASRIYSGLVRPVSSSDGSTKSIWTPENLYERDTMLSAERLSGPR